METRIPAAPTPWPETEKFWAAAAEHKLLLKRCLVTNKAFFYPRNHSPFSGSPETEWFEASGKGTIYSYSILPKASPPYCIAYVELDEGPKVLTNIVTDKFENLEIGMAVTVTFVPSESGQLIPMFRPT
ncbi:hypothetical protein HP546_25870 [Pseudomonas sp. CM25]|uniref:Zn-ribbon domain-containing OB-fold protein n=1 Tax=Pseudomonas sp. CM25 TaxID=2738448 RepID=UPI001556E6C5|nr:OB-fold domain-containing protein [Pseudomonas sp. CM25]NQD58773.1 hypothetical protein [Pseudomonas sp. CM25]